MSVTGSQTDPLNPRRGSRVEKLLWLAAILLVVGVALAFSGHYREEATGRLAAAEAAVDAADPRWRLTDLEADRAAVLDEQNGALIVLAAAVSQSRPWATAPNPMRYDLRPVEQLTAEQTAWLRSALAQVKPALEQARSLADYPTGRFTVHYAADWVSTVKDYRDAVNWTVELLDRDVDVRTQEQDFSGAIHSLLALANAGRSIGDEPGYFAQLVRTGVLNQAVGIVERILAQGQAEDRDLAEVQRLFEEEQQHPALEISLRGDRAGYHCWLRAIESGARPAPVSGVTRIPLVNYLHSAVVLPHQVKFDHAQFLSDITARCAKARIPWEERPVQPSPLGLRICGYATIPEVLSDASSEPEHVFHMSQARLRCGAALVAAERFRLAHGRWPSSTAELAPEFFPKPPTDPYLGGPLLLKRLPDGIVVYSIGPNGVDDGASIAWQENDSEEPSPILDVGYRLWDVKHRRQPPPPPKPQYDQPAP